MRVDGSIYGSLPVPSLHHQLAQKKRAPARIVAPENTAASLDTSKQRKPATEPDYSEQSGTQSNSGRPQPTPNAVEEFIHVGEHARQQDVRPRAARAIAAYQNLAQLPQREQLIRMFGVDAYA